MLEFVRPEQRHLVVQSVISIVKHAFPPLQKEHMRDLWKRKGRAAEKDFVIRRSLQSFGRAELTPRRTAADPAASVPV